MRRFLLLSFLAQRLIGNSPLLSDAQFYTVLALDSFYVYPKYVFGKSFGKSKC